MAIATWWSGDALPNLTPRAGFVVAESRDDREQAELQRLPLAEIRARRQAGNVPYVGYLNGTPVTYGWVARSTIAIGEVDLVRELPHTERYLWDFATLPEWQGHGFYPRLLQGILRQERAERFWIIYAPENRPSGAGIHKAGFATVAELSFDAERVVRLAVLGDPERARAAAAVLGLALVDDPLAPCWHCGTQTEAGCWPEQQDEAHACTCAIELKSQIPLMVRG
jgi:GNAT superfamily N-acetyltransferase